MSKRDAERLWAMQDMGGLVPYDAVPFDMGGQPAVDIGYGIAGPGGRGTGTPYAGLTQSGMDYRAMRYGWSWTVDQRFNVSVEVRGGAASAGSARWTALPATRRTSASAAARPTRCNSAGRHILRAAGVGEV